MKKMWHIYIHTMEYLVAIKRRKWTLKAFYVK